MYDVKRLLTKHTELLGLFVCNFHSEIRNAYIVVASAVTVVSVIVEL